MKVEVWRSRGVDFWNETGLPRSDGKRARQIGVSLFIVTIQIVIGEAND